MKKYISYLAALLLTLTCGLTSCSEFEPEGYKELPDLAKASNLMATVENNIVNLSWTLPQAEGITGVVLYKNGAFNQPTELAKDATSYSISGLERDEPVFFTVKVLYDGGYVSEGVSTYVPETELPTVSDLKCEVQKRTVTLNWTLPQAEGITGVRIFRAGDKNTAVYYEGPVNTAVLRGQPMDQDNKYTVQVMYDKLYPSKGVETQIFVPYLEAKMAYLLTAASPAELPDDDEVAAAEWFAKQEGAAFVTTAQVATLDADEYPVLWIEIDRLGLPMGWQNLPAGLADDATIEGLKQYGLNGGSLYLANMATQLTVPLGIVPDNMAPTVFGNGAGGSGNDVWTINALLGVDFMNGGSQGFYDHTAHAIFQGLTFEDPNGYGYDSLPLIGPGQREDHNCLWDCNIYGKGNEADVISNFEFITNSEVLATWGHVRDHCVAGLVVFNATGTHGRCVANGFAAYEWNQNSGPNPYQGNIEGLTKNILNFLK